MAKKRTVKRRKKTQAKSIGLSPAEAKAVDAQAVSELARGVESDGGVVLASYREPFGAPQAGKVVSQSPTAGTPAAKGSTVSIIVGKELPPPATTTTLPPTTTTTVARTTTTT